jgi:hypothetical protein
MEWFGWVVQNGRRLPRADTPDWWDWLANSKVQYTYITHKIHFSIVTGFKMAALPRADTPDWWDWLANSKIQYITHIIHFYCIL